MSRTVKERLLSVEEGYFYGYNFRDEIRLEVQWPVEEALAGVVVLKYGRFSWETSIYNCLRDQLAGV